MSSSDSSNDDGPSDCSEGFSIEFNNKYANVRPSSYEGEKWIWAMNATQRNNRAARRPGKWLIFPSHDIVDAVWSKIRTAVMDGKLGTRAKVSTEEGENKYVYDSGFLLIIFK